MYLSVLTNNLTWERLTKNLVTFNFIMRVHWKISLIFLWGEGIQELKEGGVRQFSDLRGEGSLVKWMGSSLPHFGRQGACLDITKSADSQANRNFSENDCMQKFYKNFYQTNDFKLRIFGKKKVFEQT